MERKVIPLTNKIQLADDLRHYVDLSGEDMKIMISEVLNEIQYKRSHIKPDDQRRWILKF
jgi:hypothetical protein